MTQPGHSRGTAMIRSEPRLWVVAAMVSAGFIPLNLLPFTVVGYGTGLHLGASQAGLLGTVELSGAILGSLAAIPFVRRVQLSTLAIVAMTAGIGLELASCAAHSFIAMATARLLLGAACGIALAAGNALAAFAVDPARYYMKVLALQSAMTIFIWSAMPSLLRIANQYGVFLGSAGALSVLLAITLLTRRPETTTTTCPRVPVTALPLHVISPITIIVTLLAVFVCCVRDGIAWTFSDKIGMDLGLSDASQTMLFAAIGAIGLVGLLGSARLNIWKYPVANVALSLAAASAMTTGLLFSGYSGVFVALALPWAAVQFLALSFLTGLAAELDPSGRLSAAAGAAFQCAYAVAPVLGGSIFARFGYGAVGVLSALLGIMTTAAGAWMAWQAVSVRRAATAAVQT